MERHMVRFEGIKHGWVGKTDIYTITVTTEGKDDREAIAKLRETYRVDKVLYRRKLK